MSPVPHKPLLAHQLFATRRSLEITHQIELGHNNAETFNKDISHLEVKFMYALYSRNKTFSSFVVPTPNTNNYTVLTLLLFEGISIITYNYLRTIQIVYQMYLPS